ncbi:AAA family ATPase [Candidatus Poribacteria bacterium]|nr:AAA family ATPase [Candidatus Poribacteria bacterium]
MYRSFRIKNFRCFKVLSIDNLERVNLIAGANNVGKTALLEAIFLHSGATRIGLTLRLNSFRGYEQLKVDEEDAPQNILLHHQV